MHIDQVISKNEQPVTNGAELDELRPSNAAKSLGVADSDTMSRYATERDKRLREDGDSQFIRLHQSSRFVHMTHDPWLPADGSVAGQRLSEREELHFKFVLKGAGYGGLLYAARLVEAGYNADDIILIDYAGGFGGTWYWNRYPGLMCDVAAEVYMPLLEETGYIPQTKYAYGYELREHADRIAKLYGLSERAIFRATIEDVTWNDVTSVWELNVVQEQGHKQGQDADRVKVIITADYMFSLAGVLNFPKLPNISGMEEYRGHQFHTSRWDYTCTGGSPTQPDMMNLRDKRVAVVGTGATAVQVIPQLAKWSKELYIIQRTPSAVDFRGQETIDPKEWKAKVANYPGWQRARRENMAAFISNVPMKPTEDLVDDRWTSISSYVALIGGPNSVDARNVNSINNYVQKLYNRDLPRQSHLRSRVEKVVHDPATAEKLKPWYPSWCKRPCFHDDYLPTFNLSNVTLVDTEGQGIDRMTSSGLVAGKKEIKTDILIWASGFSLGGGADSLGQYIVRGRKGVTMSQKSERAGYATLHGATMRGFPNFFLPGPLQAGATANQVHMIDVVCEHTIHLIKSAERSASGRKVLIEPTAAAEEDWATKVAGSSVALAAVQGCTPGYLNREGARSADGLSDEERMKASRMATWGQGILDYTKVLKDWRAKEDTSDLDITVC